MKRKKEKKDIEKDTTIFIVATTVLELAKSIIGGISICTILESKREQRQGK